MSFQNIIDYAESISIDRMKVVANTTARDGTVRTVSRGGQVWRFEVTLPDGPRWSDVRGIISKAEALDRNTAANISVNATGHRWLVQYQGNAASITGFQATVVQGASTITITANPAISSGFLFKAGDFIQLGSSGKVYTVAADVPYNSMNVTLHRPVLESSGSGIALNVAQNCVWEVVCTQFPRWTLFARDQVSWNGPFVFYESLA
jgi:hypothetical protein